MSKSNTWPTTRLKYVVRLRSSRVEGSQAERPYIGLEHIESGTGRIVKDVSETNATLPELAAESLSTAFEVGDVLFGKLRPYLAKAWTAEFAGRCSTELLVMEPLKVLPRFLMYVCLSRQFVDGVDASTFGSKMPRADWEFIGNMRIPVPPDSKQRLIADHLDSETTHLEQIVSAKEELLELFMEKRGSLVTRAVTRGIGPGAQLRGSGVAWLGNVPANWRTERAKWLFQERDERSISGEEEMLTVSHLTGVTPRSEKDVSMFEAETNEGYKLCYPGDLVINTLWAWMGAMGVSPMHGIVSPAYNVYTPSEDLEPAYVDALVRIPTFAEEATRYSKGVWSSRLRLYPEGFFEIWMPVPPIREQRAIVAYVKSEAAKLDAICAANEQTIALLKERRAALIADAVTGKILVS